MWPARSVLERTPAIVVDDLGGRFPTLPKDPWDRPPRDAAVVPIAQQGTERPAGFLVAGINPYRPYDVAYAGFFDLLAGQIASGLSNVRAYEAERKRAEALAELDRAKTAFFSNVSHELRTPLTLVLAPVEDVLKQPAGTIPPEVREFAAIAHRNGLRLLKLVNTLLDFSRIEAGRMRATLVPTDLAAFTAEVASSFRPAIEKAGLTFTVDCPPLPEPVDVDRDMWEKIVLNLLSNAFKFTGQGEIRVSLQLVGDCVTFTVQDTGIGIPPDEKVHVFDRFHRVQNAKSRSYEGTGIGLALVQELVKLHGGTIHLDSEQGVGSTFTIFLRRRSDHPPADAAAAGSEGSSGLAAAFVEEAGRWDGSFGAPAPDPGEIAEPPADVSDAVGKVLVVDDNADMRRYIVRLLSPRFDVTVAGDGSAALETLQRQKPDLVLTDVMMPNLDGFGLLQAIRSRPESRTIPVIMLSARAGEESRVEGLDAGADDYLVKPFSARELLARVSVHLQMARIRSQSEERERELRTNAEVFARALRESSERLSASLGAAGTGTFRWDLQTNLFDWDEPLERLFGLPPGQNTRSLVQLLQLIHPDDRPHVRARYERCARDGGDFEMEFRVPLPDGSIRWLDEKGQTSYDETGKPVYMIGACVDITKRKQTEAFVWRQKDVLEQIVQGAPLKDVLETLTLDVEQVAGRKLIAQILMLDFERQHLHPIAGNRVPPAWSRYIDGIEIGPSRAACGAAAWRNEHIIVSDIGNHPVWRDHRLEALRHGLRAGWSAPIVSSGGKVLGTFDVYYPEPSMPTDQELRFVEIATRTAAIAVERDRSQRALQESRAQLADYAQSLEQRVVERTARLQETISELESFSYSISHDMRAPLRAMQSFAQILEEDCGDQVGPEGKDYIRRIIGASNRMDRLIQDVLTYSRVSRNELKLDSVDLEKLLTGILESYPQFQPPQAQIELVRPLPCVLGNEAALTQCFSNLIGNALKFIPRGVTPRVKIWAERAGERARVFVKDNGIGIEKDAHEKIFRIFYQLDRSFEGTGIGLSVVRKAAERMGGSVGLASEPGQGSTFHLELAVATDPS